MPNHRIVTTIRPDGSTAWFRDEPREVFHVELPGRDRMFIQQIWANRASVPNIHPNQDPRSSADTIPYGDWMAPGDFRCNIIHVPNSSGDGQVLEYMHATKSLDFVVIIEGEIELAFTDGTSVIARPGDVIVQRGVLHSWRNHHEKTVKMFAVVIGAEGDPQTEF